VSSRSCTDPSLRLRSHHKGGAILDGFAVLPRAAKQCTISRDFWGPQRCGAGSIIVLDDPSGAACMGGGDCPCGLSAGAPPVVVPMGPVGPWGCCCCPSGET